MQSTIPLSVPYLFGPDAYWQTLDWERSFKIGMETVGLPYSGNY